MTDTSPNAIREVGHRWRLLLEQTLESPNIQDSRFLTLAVVLSAVADISDARLGNPEWGFSSETAKKMIQHLGMVGDKEMIYLAEVYEELGYGTMRMGEKEIADVMYAFGEIIPLLADLAHNTTIPQDTECLRLVSRVARAINEHRKLRVGGQGYWSDDMLALLPV